MMQDTVPMGDDYYGPQAYHSDRIPDQKRQTADLNRPWFNRKFDMRLPWGRTEEVAPLILRKRYRPEMLRKIERKPSKLENREFHQRIDHEKYRHATAALRTRVLLFIEAFGHPYLMAFIAIPMLFTYAVDYGYKPDHMSMLAHLSDFSGFLAWVYGPLLACKIIPGSLFKLFPNWFIKPAKGPQWELNRRTGLVTVFKYDKKGQWGKTGEPEEECAPFYEFDAYLTNEMIPPGQVAHTLYLVHRYRPMLVPLGGLIGKTSGEECFALWDMFQNFMDTSRPLPDIPLWEAFRPKDPVTARHDEDANRPPRYWRDMDNATWKRVDNEITARVLKLTTSHRPNTMRLHVRYMN